jgi:hypothetical protein
MPQASAVHFRPLAPAHVSAAEQLWADRFGGAPDTRRKWMEAALAPAHSAAGIVAVTPDDAVVGVSFLEVGSRRYTRQYLGLDPLKVDVSLNSRNGLLHLTCVRADWEGRGIGTAFYASAGSSDCPHGAWPARSASRGTAQRPPTADACSRSTASRAWGPSTATMPAPAAALTAQSAATRARARRPCTGARGLPKLLPRLSGRLALPAPLRANRGLCDGRGLSLGFKFLLVVPTAVRATAPTASRRGIGPAPCLSSITLRHGAQVLRGYSHGSMSENERDCQRQCPL